VNVTSSARNSRLLALMVVLVALGVVAAAASGAPLGKGGGGHGGGGTADQYVALGDSYSSGVGTGSYTLDSGCKRGIYAYPYLLAQERAKTSLDFVACSGATTLDVLSNQLSHVTASTKIVTVTVGGNDIGFADLIYQCTLSDCSAVLDATTASLSDGTLGSQLDAVYNGTKSRAASGAKIIVLGYPHVFTGQTCFGTLGISTTEEQKANALADALDTLIANHAVADGVSYQSPTGAFTGHAVCSSSPWLNGLNLANTGESYHPNKAGHSSGYLPLVRAITG
jgi:lysophospholipase L1-like esterase